MTQTMWFNLPRGWVDQALDHARAAAATRQTPTASDAERQFANLALAKRGSPSDGQIASRVNHQVAALAELLADDGWAEEPEPDLSPIGILHRMGRDRFTIIEFPLVYHPEGARL